MMLHLDTLSNIIGAGIIVLIALGMILLFALRRRIKAGKDGVEIGGKGKGKMVPCAEYIAEHSAVLARLEIGQQALSAELKGINVMQIVVTQALDVLLGLAEGEHVNGQIAKVRQNIARGEGYKEALGVDNE
jgi:hypothetical protein